MINSCVIFSFDSPGSNREIREVIEISFEKEHINKLVRVMMIHFLYFLSSKLSFDTWLTIAG